MLKEILLSLARGLLLISFIHFLKKLNPVSLSNCAEFSEKQKALAKRLLFVSEWINLSQYHGLPLPNYIRITLCVKRGS